MENLQSVIDNGYSLTNGVIWKTFYKGYRVEIEPMFRVFQWRILAESGQQLLTSKSSSMISAIIEAESLLEQVSRLVEQASAIGG